jgi:3D (Asp-Asp-Asp) domain-containing protein
VTLAGVASLLLTVMFLASACTQPETASTDVLIPTPTPQRQRPSLAHPLDPPPVITIHSQPEAPAPSPLAKPVASRGPRIVMMEVTAYCPCKVCCGRRARGLTASGKSVRYNGGAFVAADTDVLPMHTRISVPGYHRGKPIPVIDRGGDIVGKRVDVFFKSHAQAERWGRQVLPVTIVE